MKPIVDYMIRILAVLLPCLAAAAAEDPSTQARWWSEAAEQSLIQGGTNRDALLRALNQTPAAQRPAMQFLLENMPPRDLQSLSA